LNIASYNFGVNIPFWISGKVPPRPCVL